MKTLKGFLRMLRANPVFSGSFSDREDVFSNFQRPEDKDIVICYANYDNEEYEGSAMVIYFRKSTKKYYEAYGSHCSCYGLEDQWDRDEEMRFEEFEKRLASRERGYWNGNVLATLFREYKE